MPVQVLLHPLPAAVDRVTGQCDDVERVHDRDRVRQRLGGAVDRYAPRRTMTCAHIVPSGCRQTYRSPSAHAAAAHGPVLGQPVWSPFSPFVAPFVMVRNGSSGRRRVRYRHS